MLAKQVIRRHVSQYLGRFQQGDIVILRGVLRPDKIALSKPLEPGVEWQAPFGKFSHDHFIGLEPRGVVTNAKGDKFIVTHPTIEDYVVNRRRDAQPIYPFDAAAIVNLADIHVDSLAPGEEAEKLHFLEAGTGHGSLTLAICKSIHAANPKGGLQGAVLHSIDRNRDHSRTGRKNVEHFRRGIYMRDVKFHIAPSPVDWLQDANVKLSGVFLDMPDIHNVVGEISRHMRLDAPLIAFCPSITQIQDISQTIAGDATIPLVLTNVVELMPGMGGSMRCWDVRTTRVKETGNLASVCRPRVGTKVVGGGFVGIFRRLPDDARPRPPAVQPPALLQRPSSSGPLSWFKKLIS